MELNVELVKTSYWSLMTEFNLPMGCIKIQMYKKKNHWFTWQSSLWTEYGLSGATQQLHLEKYICTYIKKKIFKFNETDMTSYFQTNWENKTWRAEKPVFITAKNYFQICKIKSMMVLLVNDIFHPTHIYIFIFIYLCGFAPKWVFFTEKGIFLVQRFYDIIV